MVLIVDDKPENLLSLKSVLELNSFEVDTASSGEEALQKVLRQSYTLIILDVQMPGMDGFEVAEAISGYSKTKDIPIIFLSAVNTDKKFITKGYATGGIDYVTKPVDVDILLLKVKTFQRLYEQTQELVRIQKILNEEIDVRRRAEENLNETVQQLHSFIESIPQIAFTADTSGHIDAVNDRWFLFSNSMNEFPPAHPEDTSVEEAWQKALLEKQPVELELRLTELGKEDYRCYLLHIVPVRDPEDNIIKWVGTFTDIHLQKQANELLEKRVAARTKELIQTNKELESRNFELQQFTSVASHDLKEPLRKIQVFSSIVLNKLSNDHQEGTLQYMQRIVSASERMSGLINDLLAYSRLSVNVLIEPTNLNVLVKEILGDLEIQIAEKKAQIQVAQLPSIEAIPGQIRQLFQNIISNALKFSKPGGHPEINISASFVESLNIDAAAKESGPYCRIVIADNGIGFNETYLEKIFTIFQRLNANEAYEGTGIGLAIARKIVDKHHGLITARSRENEGARFYIILPVKHPKEKNTPKPSLQL